MKRYGFTLVELMGVIIILGVIALIVDFPVAILCVILILILHLFKKKSPLSVIREYNIIYIKNYLIYINN